MTSYVSGALKHVLQASRVAWYCGDTGIRAYIEMPHVWVQGLVAVNGKKIMGLIDDGGNEFAPEILIMLATQGVDLNQGWTCNIETNGMPINEAMEQSRHLTVRHHNDSVGVQRIPGTDIAVIFVNGIQRWRLKVAAAHNALTEMGLSTLHGWYPVHESLIKHSPR